ncbi:uracil-DNA glycosylase [Luteimicrobium sp. DT211]|uniref:uracil-DNA glycosylase n=1 Tax=Luteimicrobium sp. DT211 TaxID=3393412 RepID=UPI003CED883C
MAASVDPSPDSPARNPTRAPGARDLAALDALVVGCTACPRLVAWREQVGRERRAAFADEEYWARPVPSFGDPAARILVVGLAPAAHGGNRTGRMFTGDRSGDFLIAALHRAGLASQPTSVSRGDGLELTGARLAAPVHCVPPENKPTPEERRTCSPYLARELELVAPRVVVTLGAFGWNATLDVLAGNGWAVPRPRPRFGHGAETVVSRETSEEGVGPGQLTLLGCFHPSPHNTFTGRLTPDDMDALLARARALAAS